MVRRTRTNARSVLGSHEHVSTDVQQHHILKGEGYKSLSKRLDRASDRLDLEHRLDSEDIKLVECLGFETTTVDSLVMRTGLAADRLLARLAWLELQDYISVVPGGYVRK